MKKFSFSLSEELHAELKQAAMEQKTSMSAICREALAAHFHRQKNPYEQNLDELLADGIPEADRIAYSWQALKAQVWNFLNKPEGEPDFFSEEYINEIPGFEPVQSSDLFAHLPVETKRLRLTNGRRQDKYKKTPRRNRSFTGHAPAFNPTRFLDEIWA